MPKASIDVNDFAVRACALLATDSRASGSDDNPSKLIADLERQAYPPAAEAQHAMEVLVNLSLGPRDDQTGVAQSAKDALLRIASDPTASSHARTAIRELSFDAFVITTGDGFPKQRESKGTSSPAQSAAPTPRQHRVFELPPALLTLALRHSETCYPARKESVGDALAQSVGLKNRTATAMRDPNRYCTFPEIRNGLRTGRSFDLPCRDAPLMTSVISFGSDLLDFGVEAARGGKPSSVLIHDNNHWVAVIVGPSAQPDKVDVVVFDSLHEESSERARALAGKIRTALGEQFGKLTYAGGNVQRTTNGCGPLCARALDSLLPSREGSAASLSMDQIADALKKNIADLGSMEADKLADIVAGWRAKMLDGLDKGEGLSIDFRTQMQDLSESLDPG